ncbi:hypothetical protein JYK02_12535 [Corallococcus macrosporus]|uniref:Uncharacterized protein n=1 Tax=Corallococcus macrosporus TaxID=35 RepID=A0ABS3D9H6_9BACT|nr:hypothetical protein [Corallococcus macrosporus]MBN8228329.1 hypothetical protein [Corallococcus macrosporus]
MWDAGRWVGESDEALFATVRYDPAPNRNILDVVHATPGQLRFEGGKDDWQDMDVREQRVIEVLRRFRDANGPRAAELRMQIRVRWLTGLTTATASGTSTESREVEAWSRSSSALAASATFARCPG